MQAGHRSRSTTAGKSCALALCVVLASPFLAATAARSSDEPAKLLEAEHLATEILSIDGDVAYGEYLGGECVTCHRQSGGSDGIPPIVGLPADYTVQALVEYKLGIRTNEVMKLMTTRLANDEIAALAAYFAEMEP